ncbi:MAG: hypothetical protein OFPII_07240 [Osedax symbiont Rs1]|nr:MAG: hypothetical protein OFPII_07240 [Osedax symbiont Rs1]
MEISLPRVGIEGLGLRLKLRVQPTYIKSGSTKMYKLLREK